MRRSDHSACLSSVTRIANIVGLLGCLAACGDGGTSCKDAVTQAAARFGNANAPEVATLIGTCEQSGWPDERRECFAHAKSSAALEDCLPALDVKLPLPTLAPTPATIKLVADGPGDIRALLFFPDDSAVATVLESYFKQLGKIPTERHDRWKETALARQYKIFHDGIVLVRGDLSNAIDVDDDIEHAARSPSLRDLDHTVAVDIARLSRPRRKAYLVVGHGELTDRASLPVALQSAVGERKTSLLTRDLGDLGFSIANLGRELATDVPADATVVLVFAPAVALAPAEQAALERYLDRGGALFYALDPTVEPGLGSLEAKLGVRFNHGHLTDDKQFYPRLKTTADHRYVLTNEFTPHPTTTGIARATRGLLLVDSGTLETAPVGTAPPKVTFVVRSGVSSFIDLDNNFELTPATERRDRYNIAAAIEGPKFRALVFADTDLFADVIVKGNTGGQAAMMMLGEPLFTDSMRWLSREHEMATLHDDDLGASAKADRAAESKELLAAELELAERRLGRAYAAAIAADSHDRDDAAKRARSYEADAAKLRARVKR